MNAETRSAIGNVAKLPRRENVKRLGGNSCARLPAKRAAEISGKTKYVTGRNPSVRRHTRLEKKLERNAERHVELANES